MAQLRNQIQINDLEPVVPGWSDGANTRGSLPGFLTDDNTFWGLKSVWTADAAGIQTPRTVLAPRATAGTAGSWSAEWIDFASSAAGRSFTNAEAEWTFTYGGSSDDIAVLAKVQGSAKTAFYARVFPGTPANFDIGNITAGTENSLGIFTGITGGLTVGTKYRIRCRVLVNGANTTLRGEIATDAAPYTLLQSLSSTFATPAAFGGATATDGHCGLAFKTNCISTFDRLRWWTYASGTVYESGWFSVEQLTAGAVKLECTTPTFASGTVTYTWHRGAPGFTPSGATQIGTSTNGLFTDTTATAGEWCWKCVQTDTGAHSATSNEALGYVGSGSIGVLIVADSRWVAGLDASSTGWPGWTTTEYMRHEAQAYTRRKVWTYNAAISGTTANDWDVTYVAPAITGANAYFTGLGVTEKYAVIDLGVNSTPVAASLGATYLSIKTKLVAAGYKVIPCYTTPSTEQGALFPDLNERLIGSQPYIDSTVDLASSYNGPKYIFDALLPNGMRQDLVHETKTGKILKASSVARAIGDVFDPQVSRSGGGRRQLIFARPRVGRLR